MTTINAKNGDTITAAIGYIDIGGLAVPRAKLAEVLPDIERFERNLSLALATDAYMTEHNGYVPDSFLSLDDNRRREVAETLHEVGMLHKSAADELKAEIERRA